MERSYAPNFFLIQLDPDGSLTIRPDGNLVRHGGSVMHRTFKIEFDNFVTVVTDALSKSRTANPRPAQSL